jgi:hypothetical protein
MATLTIVAGLTSTSPRSLRNSSMAMKLSDLSPALTTTKFWSMRDFGGDHFTGAHLLAGQAFFEEGGETFRVGGCGCSCN